VEISRIEINKGGFCSKHFHRSKFNSFFLESGKLKIKVWKNDYDLCDETILEPGDFTTVNPTEFHQFEALEDCVAFEIYWVNLEADDIIRENVGGKND
jgi:quercetin dioxygenase-like cupin family protein